MTRKSVKSLFLFLVFYTFFWMFVRIKVGDSMESRKVALGIMTLSFILIVSGSVASFVLGLQKDREETYHRINDVDNTFEKFSANTSAFEKSRDELYQNYLSNVYYDTMYKEDKNVKEALSNYEHLVDELSKSVVDLNGLCKDMYYPNSDTNSKCTNYKSIYEQVMNYFVYDIQVYNKNVDLYNEYQSNNGTLFRIRSYRTDKYYIDYNGDGAFDGCEE